jgi:hypothetical protein
MHRREDNINLDLEINRLLGCGLDLSGSDEKPVAGSCEYKVQSFSSIKDREFLDQASDYQFPVDASITFGRAGQKSVDFNGCFKQTSPQSLWPSRGFTALSISTP